MSSGPRRDRRAGAWRIAAGLALMLAGGALMLSARYGAAMGLPRPDLWAGLALAACGLAAMAFGVRLATTGRALRTEDAGAALSAAKVRAPVLYLRSFAVDVADARKTVAIAPGVEAQFFPFEGSLTDGFAHVGPIIAIGRPGEKFATPGARRLYVSDDEWRAKVREMAEAARLIVWVWGETEGLKWELSRLTADHPPEKLVIALPFQGLTRAARAATWAKARAALAAALPAPPPDDIGEAHFLIFEPDWTPRLVEGRPPHPLKRFAAMGGWNRVAEGARAVAKLRGAPAPPPSVAGLIAYTFVGCVWLILALTVVTMIYGAILRHVVTIPPLEWLVDALFG